MTLEEMEAYFRANPPKLPESIRATPLRHSGPWGGHHEPFAVHWALRCACGVDRFAAEIWTGTGEGRRIKAGPAVLRCTGCQAEATVFDARHLGHEAIACETAATLHGPDLPASEQQICGCDRCGGKAFSVAVGLHYPDDLFTAEFDAFRGRESDLFTWFHLLGFCDCAGGEDISHQVLLNLECA